jgi:CO/xanthine dehydrogenase FAD-binding subunit
MQYFEPNFIDEALVVLERFGDEAKIVAGATLLGPALREGRSHAKALVNVKRIAALRGIERRGHTLHVGAACTADAIAHDSHVRELARPLASAAAGLGCRQLRSLATIGGNCCSGYSDADLTTALIACGAVVTYADRAGATSQVPIEDHLRLVHGGSAVALVRTLDIPIHTGAAASYVKMQTRSAFEMSIVSVAVRLRMERGVVTDARIALGGAGETALFASTASAALIGRRLDEAASSECAHLAAQADAHPRDDARASAAYRRHLVAVLVRRALAGAVAPSAVVA